MFGCCVPCLRLTTSEELIKCSRFCITESRQLGSEAENAQRSERISEGEVFLSRMNADLSAIGGSSSYRNRCLWGAFLRVLVGLLVGSALTPIAETQISTAAIVGTTTDSSGATLVG